MPLLVLLLLLLLLLFYYLLLAICNVLFSCGLSAPHATHWDTNFAFVHNVGLYVSTHICIYIYTASTVDEMLLLLCALSLHQLTSSANIYLTNTDDCSDSVISSRSYCCSLLLKWQKRTRFNKSTKKQTKFPSLFLAVKLFPSQIPLHLVAPAPASLPLPLPIFSSHLIINKFERIGWWGTLFAYCSSFVICLWLFRVFFNPFYSRFLIVASGVDFY